MYHKFVIDLNLNHSMHPCTRVVWATRLEPTLGIEGVHYTRSACGATWVVVRVPVLNLRRGRKGHIAPAAHDVAPSNDDRFMAYNDHTFIHTYIHTYIRIAIHTNRQTDIHKDKERYPFIICRL